MSMKKRDVAVLLGILAVALLGILLWMIFSKKGNEVYVYVNNEEQAVFSLDEDVTFEIVTGEGTNLLIIRDGYATVTEADCPDGLCISMGRISKVGQSIICLPHKVSIEIHDAKE